MKKSSLNTERKIWLTALAAALLVVISCAVIVTAVTCRERGGGSGITVRLDGSTPIYGEDGVTLLEGGEAEEGASASIPSYVQLKDGEEMRAVWIAYMSTQDITREKIDKMVADCKELGANAIIFHVRAFGDALYPSEFFPWSHLMTGTQGTAPADGFDPLAYIIDRAHANGMQLHAWVNPLRIQLEGGKTPAQLSSDNPYSVWRGDASPDNDHWVIDYNGGKFYNPGVAEVRKLIVNGVGELAANYNVDGIHWDDYFYPATDGSFDDSIAYQQYLDGGGDLDLLQWRTNNINTLVRDCYNKIKAYNSNCTFGISPAGNIENCLNAGADVYEWCAREGYIDYICPQIYWSFTSKVAPFAERCAAWRGLVKTPSVKFYVGLALYKAGSDADSGTWHDSDSTIADQIEYIRDNGVDADGFMLYSYDYLDDEQTAVEVANIREVLA